MMASLNKKIALRSHIICSFCKLDLSVAKNLARHIKRTHKKFLEIRSIFQNISEDRALELTIQESLQNLPVPKEIYNKYMSEYRPLDKYFTIKKDSYNINVEKKKIGDEEVGEVGDEEVDEVVNEEVDEVINITDICKKEKQSHLSFSCNKCNNIGKTWETGRKLLLGLVKDQMKVGCNCNRNDECCCEIKINEIKNKLESEDVNDECAMYDFKESFFIEKLDEGAKFFCKICYKYSSSVQSRHRGKEDWAYNGYSTKNRTKGELNLYMKRHIKSKQHIKCLSLQKDQTAKNKYINLSQKCAENFCLAAIFCACHHESVRFFTDLCNFIDMTGKNLSEDFIHPLGNKYQHSIGIQKAQIAAYNSIRDDKKTKFKNISPLTLLPPSVMLAADKGTVHKDVTQQVIVATVVGNDGLPSEILVTASGVTDPSAAGAAQHFNNEVSKLIAPQQVSVICTDGASYYTGKERGMIQRLKKQFNFNNKLIFLSDVCHKAELLFGSSLTMWVDTTLDSCKNIVNAINNNSELSKGLFDYSQVVNKKFVTLPTVPETRFSEYTHKQTKAILLNLEIFNDFLPDVLENEEYKKNSKFDAMRILQVTTSNEFVASVLFVDKIYYHLALMEKSAQSETFGPVDFIKNTSNFKKFLEDQLEDTHAEILQILIDGKVCMKLKVGKNEPVFKIQINLNELKDKIGKNLRKVQEHWDVLQEFKDWIYAILQNFETYLGSPKVFTLLSAFLNITLVNIESRKIFLEIFLELNIDFYKCSEQCTGLEYCGCVTNELTRFFNHFNKTELVNLQSKISYYFDITNNSEISNLKIINVLRVLEITQLLKPSQSSTERVISFLKKVVEGHYENVYRFGKTHKSGYDMVDVITQIGYKNDIRSFDYKSACNYLMEQQKINVLWENKPPQERSHTIKRIISDKARISRKKSKIDQVYPISLELNDSFTADDVEPLSERNPIVEGIVRNECDESSDSEEEMDKDYVYCCQEKVMADDRCKYWVRCDNNKKCLNYLQILKETGCSGGQWFHLKCSKLKKPPKRTQPWKCHICRLKKS